MLGILTILLLVFTTSFFVAAEFSIVSVRKTRLEQLIAEGNKAALGVQGALDHLERYLAAIQIGVTMASLGLGALGEPVLGEFFTGYLEEFMPPTEAFISAHSLAIALSFLVITILEIVLGEVVPKIIARQRSEATALLLIRPLNIFVLIFRPFIWVVSLISGLVLRVLGLRSGGEYPNVYSVEELELLMASSRQAGVLDREEEVIIRRVFDFGDLTARQVMLPRTEIVGIPVEATLSEVAAIMADEPFSRFPVYERDLDQIIGVLHVRDIFKLLTQAGGIAPLPITGVSKTVLEAGAAHIPHFRVRNFMRTIEPVPETIDVDNLLTEMQQKGMQIVLVIDEYGGTAGIVTLEDILEEIVGDVRSEFEEDDNQAAFVVTTEGTLVDGLVAIDDVNEMLDLNIVTEADTLGGHVFEILGRKPELGDEVTSDGTALRVEEMDGLRISKVRVLTDISPAEATLEQVREDSEE